MNLICHVIDQNPDAYLGQLRCNASAEGDGCIANAIIRNGRNEILVLRRSQNRSLLPLCWDLPGGHVENNETLEQGLHREVMEEIGVSLHSIDALIAHWAWRSPKSPHRKMQQFDFLATLEPGPPIHLNLEEFVESRWLASNELWLFQENRAADDVAMRDVLRHAFNLLGAST
jgi:mutator protein MutT